MAGELPGQRRVRGVTRPLVEAARELRRELTPAERVLWEALRSRQVAGLRFRCQHAIGPFVLDFLCPAARLIVEIDGSIHDQQGEQDEARTQHLEAYGYRVIRFRNEQVLNDLPFVLAQIERTALSVPPAQRQRQGSRITSPLPAASNKPPA